VGTLETVRVLCRFYFRITWTPKQDLSSFLCKQSTSILNDKTDNPCLSERIIERLLATKQVTLKRLLDATYQAVLFEIRSEYDNGLAHPAELKASTENNKWTRWQLFEHRDNDE
jgi:hypothetical protein